MRGIVAAFSSRAPLPAAALQAGTWPRYHRGPDGKRWCIPEDRRGSAAGSSRPARLATRDRSGIQPLCCAWPGIQLLLTMLGDRMEVGHTIDRRVPFLDHEVGHTLAAQPVHMRVREMTERCMLQERFSMA